MTDVCQYRRPVPVNPQAGILGLQHEPFRVCFNCGGSSCFLCLLLIIATCNSILVRAHCKLTAVGGCFLPRRVTPCENTLSSGAPGVRGHTYRYVLPVHVHWVHPRVCAVSTPLTTHHALQAAVHNVASHLPARPARGRRYYLVARCGPRC